MTKHKIDWLNRPGTTGETWNVAVGCSKVSAGCQNCYAEKMALRLAHMALADIEKGRDPGRKRHYLDVVDLERGCWNGQIKLLPEALDDPNHWKKPRTVFVNSMSDLFHEGVPGEFIHHTFQAIHNQWFTAHKFLILTKRPARMRDLYRGGCLKSYGGTCSIWLGATIEKPEYSYRADYLRQCSAAIRFLSLEPLLGSFADHPGTFDDMDWVIVGGETGPGARPMDPQWARNIRDGCQAAGIPFFFKQMSNKATIPDDLMVREWPNT